MASENYAQNANRAGGTRAGISPDDNGLPFTISTQQAEEYIVHKLAAVFSKLKNEAKSANDGVDYERAARDVNDIKVISSAMGEKMIPFVIMLPMSFVVNSGNSRNDRRNNNMMTIFRQYDDDEDSNNVHIIQPVYSILAAYAYNKADANAFQTNGWRIECGVSRQGATRMKMLRTPKITKLNGGKSKYVILLLDPLRVFHDMITNDADKRQFTVGVKSWKKCGEAKYIYYIKKLIASNKDNNKNYKDQLIKELSGRINGR